MGEDLFEDPPPAASEVGASRSGSASVRKASRPASMSFSCCTDSVTGGMVLPFHPVLAAALFCS